MKDVSSASGFGSEFNDGSIDTVTAGYTDGNICGEGASCTVYRMRLDGLLVAVKRLRPELRANPAFIASYRKEYQLGQRLKHDAIPVYRQLRADMGEVYIVMDYVDGISLDEFVKTDSGKTHFGSTDNARLFLTQLVNVTGYLHRSGVIHCDLKPANIMVRNSDRAAMLLDLDKAYCDILDSTHGGSTGGSDPLTKGEKPTAAKDYAAIGKIFDSLAEAVPGFNESRFRRFRRECDNAQTTPERLLKTLQPASRKALWFSLGIVTLMAVIALALSYMDRNADNQTETIPIPADTVVKVINTPAEISAESVPVQESKAASYKDVVIDFDAEMADFISDARTQLSQMKSGGMSDREVHDMTLKMSGKYFSIYHEIVIRHKEKHPDMPGIDIELAVAAASEKSRASRLIEELTQAAADTMRQRHPELYDDVE